MRTKFNGSNRQGNVIKSKPPTAPTKPKPPIQPIQTLSKEKDHQERQPED